MPLLFERRLAIPLWAVVFFAAVLTAPPAATLFLMPPTTAFAIAAVGIAAIVFLMPQLMPWLRASPARVRVVPSRYRDRVSASPGCHPRKLHAAKATEADDALDLVRMDDDGGWQLEGSHEVAPVGSLPIGRPGGKP